MAAELGTKIAKAAGDDDGAVAHNDRFDLEGLTRRWRAVPGACHDEADRLDGERREVFCCWR